MFDYISIILFVILGIGFLIGFWRGAFKMLARFVVLGAAIGVAFLFCKLLGNALMGTGFGSTVKGWMYDFACKRINFEIVPGVYSITGETQINESTLRLMDIAGQAYYGDANWTALHAMYAKLFMPESIYGTLDECVYAIIKAFEGGHFAMAAPLSDALAQGLMIGMSFVALFFGTWIIGTIVVAIVGNILAKSPLGPSLLSRLLGGLVGLALAAGIVWTLGLTLNLLMMMENGVSDHIRAVIKYDDPSAWTFAKWLCQTNFGYSGILAFFLK